MLGEPFYLRDFARSFDAGDRSVGDGEQRVKVNLKFALNVYFVLVLSLESVSSSASRSDLFKQVSSPLLG